MKKRQRHILLGVLVFLLGGNILLWALLGIDRVYAQKIYPGVWYGNTPLGNLTLSQAQDLLQTATQNAPDEQITLAIDSTSYQTTLSELGYTVDSAAMAKNAYEYGRNANLLKVIGILFPNKKVKSVPLAYNINQTTQEEYLKKASSGLLHEPKNMAVIYKDGNVSVVPAEDGVTIDSTSLADTLRSQIVPGKTTTVTLTSEKKKPEIFADTQVAKAKTTTEQLTAQPLTIKANDKTYEWSPTLLYSFLTFTPTNGELVVGFDESKVKTEVANLAKKIDIAAIAKRASTKDGSTIEEGQDGLRVNQAEAVKLVMNRLQTADLSTPVDFPTDKIERKVVTESPEYELGRYPGRYLEVDLSAQKLFMIDGNELKAQFRVSTGKWDTPTPKGNFFIKNHIPVAWSKKHQLYMPSWQAIIEENGSYEGYGIHGLPYWPGGKVEGTNHIGRQVSHGCIRLGPGDEKTVYNWTVDNETRVVIHD